MIDIGTGDGLFVYRSARLNRGKFFIGVDANARPLEKVSERIHRRAAKGGVPNALFIQAAVESLPVELHGVAHGVHVHFPWGSLLRGIATPDRAVLADLRRICAANAVLEVVAGLDQERDRSEVERLSLPPLSVPHIDTVLAPRYRDAGFDIVRRGILSAGSLARLNTAWAKRLRGSRTVYYFVARALD